MTPRPYKPEVELQGALKRGELSWAITCAAEVKRVELETALRFLPLVTRETPEEYDRWALRWLGRWLLGATADRRMTRTQAASCSGRDWAHTPKTLKIPANP